MRMRRLEKKQVLQQRLSRESKPMIGLARKAHGIIRMKEPLVKLDGVSKRSRSWEKLEEKTLGKKKQRKEG